MVEEGLEVVSGFTVEFSVEWEQLLLMEVISLLEVEEGEGLVEELQCICTLIIPT
jgi:hypothetical protein